MASDTLTYFIYATLAIYGFFTVGMITDAKLFFASDSPMCYWTTFDASAEWFAGGAGTLMFFLIMSPYYAGVSYATLAKMLLPLNVFLLGLFIQSAFFLDVTGPDGCSAPMMDMNLFIPQVGLGVTMTIWNILALDGDFSISSVGMSAVPYFNLAMAMLYAAFFGTTLMIAPAFFWGPDSMFCYWEVFDEAGQWFARAVGCAMCVLYFAPFYAGLAPGKLTTISLPVNIFFLSYFFKAAFFISEGGPGANALLPFNLWIPQLAIGLTFLIWNIKEFGMSLPKAMI